MNNKSTEIILDCYTLTFDSFLVAVCSEFFLLLLNDPYIHSAAPYGIMIHNLTWPITGIKNSS